MRDDLSSLKRYDFFLTFSINLEFQRRGLDEKLVVVAVSAVKSVQQFTLKMHFDWSKLVNIQSGLFHSRVISIPTINLFTTLKLESTTYNETNMLQLSLLSY